MKKLVDLVQLYNSGKKRSPIDAKDELKLLEKINEKRDLLLASPKSFSEIISRYEDQIKMLQKQIKENKSASSVKILEEKIKGLDLACKIVKMKEAESKIKDAENNIEELKGYQEELQEAADY